MTAIQQERTHRHTPSLGRPCGYEYTLDWGNDSDLGNGSDIEFAPDLDRLGSHVVRIIAPNPVSAQIAMHAFRNGEIGGAVTVEDLELASSIEDSLCVGLGCVSKQVVRLALGLPQLTTRQCELLTLVARGRSNEALAETSHCSISTLKREVRTVLRLIRCKRSDVRALLQEMHDQSVHACK